MPGSAVGEFFGWGDYSYGGMGTTTYTTTDDELVAFGHPMLWDGQVQGFLTNCDTIGLWSNLDAPFKMLAPGMIRGAVTVDSGPGIAGTVGDQAIPTEVPLISTATNEASGQTVTQTTYVTPYAVDQIKDPFPELNASAFYPAMFQAMGNEYYDGHLSYELTVDVTDGTHSYQIVRDNRWRAHRLGCRLLCGLRHLRHHRAARHRPRRHDQRPHHRHHACLAALAAPSGRASPMRPSIAA